jgi:hypothetical protein
MNYIAYLCYSSNSTQPTIVFTRPADNSYDRIICISFSVLLRWSDKDVDLFTTS